MDDPKLRRIQAILAIVSSALAILAKAVQMWGHIPPGWFRIIWIGPTHLVIICYLAAYIVFDLWDAFRYKYDGWLIALVFAVVAVVFWFILVMVQSPEGKGAALGFLLAYSLYDGLDGVYYRFRGWGWVVVSASVSMIGLIVLWST